MNDDGSLSIVKLFQNTSERTSNRITFYYKLVNGWMYVKREQKEGLLGGERAAFVVIDRLVKQRSCSCRP